MICLDTNFLIGMLVPDSREFDQVIEWTQSGDPLVTSSVAWYEFLCGPVSAHHIATIRPVLREVVAFDELHAAEAAHLFNSSGRSRQRRVDAMIAATALILDAKLATNNRSDFQVFTRYGLRLVD
jgi:predicted nucleic acid-binding protein